MTPRAALATVAAGVALIVLGVAGGFVFAEDEDLGAGATQSSTSTAALEETPADLYALVEAAIRAGDADTLFARLDQAVLDVYGADQCRAYLAGFDDPDVTLEVVAVDDVTEWHFGVGDGLDISIDDAIPVELRRTKHGTEADTEVVHVRRVGRRLRWFTDCGDPIG